MADHEGLIGAMMSRIEIGIDLEKCRKCGCMAGAFNVAESLAARIGADEMLEKVRDYKRKMEEVAYECLGCEKCWGAEASNLAHEAGGEAENIRCENTQVERAQGWPVVAGEYVLGNPGASVAVCTLGGVALPAAVVGRASGVVAIAGKCETENIGIEKIVLNVVSNPNIRWLILCGNDPEGHLPGDALLHLKKSGVDANMRILNTAARRPILKNLSVAEVARFRKQVEAIDRIGCIDIDEITSLANELGDRAPPPLTDWEHQARRVPHVDAKRPERTKLDRAGFFIIIPDRTRGIIACEHYSNDGILTTVIEGVSADLIVSTAIEKGLIGQLDHAAYLGRELARAEVAMRFGIEYIQDRALGELPREEKKGEVDTSEHKINDSCGCGTCD